MVSTNRRIREALTRNGLVLRHLGGDGLPGAEGAFALCTLRLAESLAGQGNIQEAGDVMETVLRPAGPLGLLSEEIEPGTGESLGNYPQGFTHLGVISAAAAIAHAGDAARGRSAGHRSAAGRARG